MASTALSCVLWWRWFGILVMFHGMDRHSGIRTDSQDAARTAAAGHRAQDTASRDTESPGKSMSVGRSVGSETGVRWSHGSAVGASGKVSATHGELDPNQDVVSPLIGAFCAAAAVRGRRIIETWKGSTITVVEDPVPPEKILGYVPDTSWDLQSKRQCDSGEEKLPFRKKPGTDPDPGQTQAQTQAQTQTQALG
ncbi:hypothetical protein FQN60_000136, partial [Etheostoma spectabile]